MHAGIERQQRHRQVRGVRRHAVRARAEDRVQPVLAAAGRAAGTGLALVAGQVGAAEVAAAGALQEVAADGREVAHLRRRAGLDRLGQRRPVAPDLGMAGDVGQAGQRADTQRVGARIGPGLDAVERQAADVDQLPGRGRALLEKLQQVGAAGDERRVGMGGGERQRRALARRAMIGDRLHVLAPCGLGDGGDDVGIGAAAAEVAAHLLGDLGVAARSDTGAALGDQPSADMICPGVQ